MPVNSKLPAIFSCLFAASLLGFMWFPLRTLNEMGMPWVWVSVCIYVPALIVAFPFLLRMKLPKPASPMLFLLITLAAGWGNLAYILAMLEGTVARVLLLFYLYPIWAVVLARIFLKEAIAKMAYFHFALAFSGAIILLWNDQFTLEISYADALAISSGFAFSLSNLSVRKLGDIPLIFKMAPVWLGVLTLTAIWFSLGKVSDIEFHGVSLLPPLTLAVVIGVFCIPLITYSAQYGVTHLPIHQSATLFLLEVPIGSLSAYLLSQEVMGYQEWIGGSLVMLAAWLSAKLSINSNN